MRLAGKEPAVGVILTALPVTKREAFNLAQPVRKGETEAENGLFDKVRLKLRLKQGSENISWPRSCCCCSSRKSLPSPQQLPPPPSLAEISTDYNSHRKSLCSKSTHNLTHRQCWLQLGFYCAGWWLREFR